MLYYYRAMAPLLLSQAVRAESQVAGFMRKSLLSTGLYGLFELVVT